MWWVALGTVRSMAGKRRLSRSLSEMALYVICQRGVLGEGLHLTSPGDTYNTQGCDCTIIIIATLVHVRPYYVLFPGWMTHISPLFT